MDIVIRDAQMADAPAVVGLILDLAATEGERSPITEGYVARYLGAGGAWRTGAVSMPGAACMPGAVILLAEAQQQVVGLLSYSLRPDLYHAASVCLIEEFIVLEAARRQGVGSALLAELLSRLERLECAEVSVAVMPDNAEALKFYRRHGLTEEAVFLEKHFPIDRPKG